MKLGTKLLVGVGLLLLVLALILYILPSYLVKKDVYKAVKTVQKLIVNEQKQLTHTQEIWLDDIFIYTKQNNDAMLIMLSEDPKFSKELSESNLSMWNALAHTIGYDPTIDFVQAHSPKENRTAVILQDAATLYPIQDLTLTNEWIHGYIQQENELKPFLGVPLPQISKTASVHTYYALLSPKNLPEELSKVHEEIAQRKPLNAQTNIDEQLEKVNEALSWAVKVSSIRVLTPLYLEGLKLGFNDAMFIPEGIARINKQNEGHVILSNEVFYNKPLFDDVSHFDANPPEEGAPPVASRSVLITLNERNEAYIGNTALLNTTYLTIGSSLSQLAKQLALASSKMVLVQIKGDVWLGFNETGERMTKNEVESFTDGRFADQPSGTIEIDGKSYSFNRITSLQEGDLVFYNFDPMQAEQSILETLYTLRQSLAKRISCQLLLISLGTIALILLFIERISYAVIRPIRKLASATQDVAAGRYEQVSLPDVDGRRDEVATLTHAFGDMVKGLQDREKIRAVLDKVVSKDVADEILKTQIHLGGEDRMVTMLFGDIRDFTRISSTLSPQEIIQMLNECMTKVSRVIEGEGGVIDKYVGDEVMAIYGAPAPHKDHALRAISSAMLILETLKKWNEQRTAAGKPVIEMGMGIHTGIVVAGNMGAEDRLNYTVVGAHVNLAARLCEAAKPNQLIISAATLAQPDVESSFYAKALPTMHFKGIAEPVQIYEITGFKWEG